MNIKSVMAAVGITMSAIGGAPAEAAEKHRLDIDVHNPGASGIFPVSSTIISGPTEAVLIDAQFQRSDAQALVKKLEAKGKTLTAIYISHADPDFYFGLDTIVAAFPGVKVVATPATVAAIKASKDGKLQYWTPILKENAPSRAVVPEPLAGDSLTVDGETLRIVGLDGPTPGRTFVWVPSRKAVLGGVVVFANSHVWVADTQSVESRRDWFKTLASIESLSPAMVIPGHYLPNADGTNPFDGRSVAYTREYLKTFEAEAAKAADSTALIAAMKAHYPDVAGSSILELSAKVIKGEMKWPAK
jgi:glyoxylase-like metal-dependent hydrolase (beta-lactamase superfamily II)